MLSCNSFQLNNERKVYTTEIEEEYNEIREKNKNSIAISIHSGTFHADEVLATLLLKFHPSFKESFVIRTRNELIISKCDIVCDVGGKLDPKNFRFDHHMKEFTEVFSNDNKYKGIKMSSAGLVYKYLGKDILINILKKLDLYEQNKKYIDEIYTKIYDSFILSVDAKDNGVSQFDSNVELKYTDHTTYSDRVGRLNPEWNSKNVDVNMRFKKAWDITEEELYFQINKYANSYYLAYDIVNDAVQVALNNNKPYIVLEQYCPWLGIYADIEEKLKLEKNKILFGIIPVQNNQWSCRTIPVKKDSLSFKKGLVNKWRGRRDKELQEISGIKDAVFVHTTGFIGFFESKESAIKASELSILDK